MKCKYCGNNLQMEDKVCPFCGRTNPFAKQHQKEMERFSKKFEATRKNVLQESARFNRKTVRITILSVLVALCAVFAVLCVNADDIRYYRQDKAIERNADEYRAGIIERMEARDYIGLYCYMRENDLDYADPLQEYGRVYAASSYYSDVLADVMVLHARAHGSELNGYRTSQELLEAVAKNIHNINDVMDDSYNPEYLAGDKGAYLEDMQEEIRLLFRSCLHLTEEEAEQIFTLSQARLTILLEEAYAR